LKNVAEKMEFSYCTGIVPRDWNEEEDRAFNEGKIDRRGFLLPEFRAEFFAQYAEACGFTQHPEPLIRGLILARHGVFPENSHASKLVMDCRKVENFDN
jgi:hypothetical protein